jgi:hypothetical protein
MFAARQIPGCGTQRANATIQLLPGVLERDNPLTCHRFVAAATSKSLYVAQLYE